MSKEATGQLGVKLGSSAYWAKLNNAAGLNTLMGSEPKYYRMLQQTGNRASAAIDEIYDDLASQGSKIRYISSSNRNALAKQVEGLYDVCKLTGVLSSHSSDCIYALNMSALSPWLDPFRDERAIDRTISIINTQSHFSTSEALKLLEEGPKWSVSFVAGSDKMKEALLLAVLQGKSNSAFLQDVVNEYQHRNTMQHFTGKCGYEIGSRAYLEHFEAQVFGASISVSKEALIKSARELGERIFVRKRCKTAGILCVFQGFTNAFLAEIIRQDPKTHLIRASLTMHPLAIRITPAYFGMRCDL